MSMMTAEQLRASILQFAMEGKLVEQRPEEGTGEELFQKIQDEKARLVKEGKIKKQKPLPEITNDEKPFDIPESWSWVRLGEISSTVTKGTTPRGGNVSYSTSGIGFLRAENIAGLDNLNISNLKYVTQKMNDGFLSRSIIMESDVLITIAGTLGRTALVRKADLPLNANQAVSIVRLVNPQKLDLLFIIYALNASAIQRSLVSQKKITAIPNLTLEIISDCCIPLPPLAEQHRIVYKIKELMPFVDNYAISFAELEKLNRDFPDMVKKSILQMAVEGKLVEQRPEEGTGEELFRKIQEEKAKLVKEGKIKKQKPLADITDEEKPFDIPESWKWLRLDQISTVVTDGEHKTPRRVSKYCGYYLLSARNVLNGSIQLSDVDYVDEEEFLSISKRCNPVRGDVLISCSGTIGRCTIVDDDNAYVMVRSAAMVRALIVPEYLMYCLQSAFLQEQMRKNAKQTAQANLFQAAIRNLVLPVPPLEEQKRIVKKLHNVLPTVNKLK